MRNKLLLIFMLPSLAAAQVCTDFESGIPPVWLFSSASRWSADSVNPLSDNYSLHHIFDNPDAGFDVAGKDLNGLDPEMGEIRWSFLIRHGYSPSSSNRWGVYLQTDLSPEAIEATSPISGFVLGVNQVGYDDTLRLWEATGGILKEIITTEINWQNDIGVDSSVSFQIGRSPGGNWFISLLNSSDSITRIYYGNCPGYLQGGYFAICYKYSSSQDRLLWVDDICIEGEFVNDTTAPVVIETIFNGANRIEVEFSEPLNPTSLSIDNFLIHPGDINPARIENIGSNKIRLVLGEPLSNKESYNITIESFCDLNNNCSSNQESLAILAYPEWGDLIITEFMTDPIPWVGLPEKEYFEIFNASDYSYSPGSLILTIDEKPFLPEGQMIEPGEYYIVCDISDSTLFTGFGKILTAGTLRQINDKQGIIMLCDTAGNAIHGIEYDREWFSGQLKEDGGWSLEIIDTDYPFSGSANWSFSVNRNGGSPGKENSVKAYNPDLYPPFITNLFPTSDSVINLSFSEPVFPGQGYKYDDFEPELQVEQVVLKDMLKRTYELRLAEKLQPGMIYELNLPESMADMAGNNPENMKYRFGLPSEAMYNDLVFNEIMFDPLPWETEYIEFYNRSSKILDASSLIVCPVNRELADTGSCSYLSNLRRCILPGSFYVITESLKIMLERYPGINREVIFEVDNLPSMPDREGELLLYNRHLDLIDRVNYTSEMHFDLLATTEGVSLERIDTEKPSNDPENWTSASSLSGWGTPGMPNSSGILIKPESSSVVLSTKRITPDGDGFEDKLDIFLSFTSINQVITILIFDDSGYRVRTLGENLTCGFENTLSWFGKDDNGNPLSEGIYIILVKSVSPVGEIKIWKRVCAVILD